MLKPGIKAPDVSLPDENGVIRTLEEFRGKKIVLYFYSKDNTSGCTKQACNYSDIYPMIKEKNAVVIGVSKDSSESHKKFKDKYSLPFILLSDTELKTIKDYDVWGEKTMYGRKTFGVVRTTYVIDENGVIVNSRGKVKAADDPAETLELI